MNTFDDDNEVPFFNEPRRRPPRERTRPPQRSGQRRGGPPPASNPVLRLAALLAVGLAIVFGLVLSSAGDSKADYSSYMNAMQPLAQKSASVGAAFAKALGTSGLTLATFDADLATWKAEEQSDYVAAQRLQPPGPLQSAHAAALETFYLREAALTNLASHLDQATQAHDSATAAAAVLEGDAQLLSTSDVMWQQLYQLVASQVLTAQHVTGVNVPASQIVSSSEIVSRHSLATLYERLRTPTGGGGQVTGVHGSRLVGTNVVENGVTTALSTTTATTVSCCGNVAFDVMFADSGGYPEVNVKVTLTVDVAGQSVYTNTQTVPQIAVGGTATVPFSSVQVPTSAFGHNASISVTVHKVKGEAKLDNNSATYPVYFELSH